jgi:RNA polymerase sigma-70 factor (ECF subfamily)
VQEDARTVDDAELIDRSLEGDRDAFGVLVRRHFGVVWSAALSLTGDPTDAEDVSQEAVVRAWERLGQCRDPSRFRAWLVRVTRTVGFNWIDARGRRNGRLEPLSSQTAPGPSPLDTAWHGELGRILLAAAAELTDLQRTVLLLYDLEGWRHAEIADALDITEVSSRRHLSDARRRMRSLLSATLPRDGSLR